MAKQGGGIARFTSFFGVAEYEREGERQSMDGAEEATLPPVPDTPPENLDALPAPVDGEPIRRYSKRPLAVVNEESAQENWEGEAVHNTMEESYVQDQYTYDSGDDLTQYPQGYDAIDDYTYEEEEDELRRITTIHPRSYNDAKIIGEAFREDIPVIMNVDDMPDTDAKRLVDFASGLVFALNGRIERVTTKVFLLTPSNLEVLGMNSSDIPQTYEDEGLIPFDQG